MLLDVLHCMTACPKTYILGISPGNRGQRSTPSEFPVSHRSFTVARPRAAAVRLWRWRCRALRQPAVSAALKLWQAIFRDRTCTMHMLRPSFRLRLYSRSCPRHPATLVACDAEPDIGMVVVSGPWSQKCAGRLTYDRLEERSADGWARSLSVVGISDTPFFQGVK
jgi:hypothetical protein